MSVDNRMTDLLNSFAIRARRDIFPRVVERETDRRNRRRLLTISSALSNSRAVRSKERRARRGPAASDGTQVPHEPRTAIESAAPSRKVRRERAERAGARRARPSGTNGRKNVRKWQAGLESPPVSSKPVG